MKSCKLRVLLHSLEVALQLLDMTIVGLTVWLQMRTVWNDPRKLPDVEGASPFGLLIRGATRGTTHVQQRWLAATALEPQTAFTHMPRELQPITSTWVPASAQECNLNLDGSKRPQSSSGETASARSKGRCSRSGSAPAV